MYKGIFAKFKLEEFLIITALGIVIGFLMCPKCYLSIELIIQHWRNLLLSIIYTYILGYGCGFIMSKMSKTKILENRPVNRFILNLIIIGAYAFIASMIIVYLYVNFILKEKEWVTIGNLMNNAILPMWIAIGLGTFFSGVEYLNNWKKEAIRAEQLEKEKIATQYESLRNQVNPHFLFNSLNTLTSLVYDDQELAVKYIRQLSEVYRYVLDSRNKELASFTEELRFLNAFVFLQKIRFDDKLTVNIKLGESEQKYILPLAIQIILENAIKHNEISDERPLSIDIYEEEGYIIIENKINRKNSIGYSSGIGINNISQRYKHLTEREVLVHNSNGKFKVQLPILKEKT